MQRRAQVARPENDIAARHGGGSASMTIRSGVRLVQPTPKCDQWRFFLVAVVTEERAAFPRFTEAVLFRADAVLFRADAVLRRFDALRRALADDARSRRAAVARALALLFDALQAARLLRALRPADFRASARPRLTVQPEVGRYRGSGAGFQPVA